MTLLPVHILAAALWFGTAATLPFWGNRMNRADNLSMVLGIADTVFLLKNLFIMGGLVVTLVTGVLLTQQYRLPFFDFGTFFWLGISQVLCIVIAINSLTILAFMLLGRRGLRHYYRLVPPFGYNNIGLIALVYIQMTVRPPLESQGVYLGLPLLVIAAADTLYFSLRLRRRLELMGMRPDQFAQRYFGYMNDENMYGLLGLFRDDAKIEDTFAVGVVRGAKEIERFFQFLGDQFDHIKMHPVTVTGERDSFIVHWRAHGVTKNGSPMHDLRGTNHMRRKNGKISSMHIEFDLRDLPQVELYRAGVREAYPLAEPTTMLQARS